MNAARRRGLIGAGLALLAIAVGLPDLRHIGILATAIVGSGLIVAGSLPRPAATVDARRRRVLRVGGVLVALQMTAMARAVRIGVVHPAETASRRAVSDDEEVLSNPRTARSLLTRPRGRIMTSDGVVLARSRRRGDVYAREYPEPPAYSFVGYASPLKFGLSGLEASLDARLTGTRALSLTAALRTLLLGETDRTATAHLTIDSSLQRSATQALDGLTGSCVLMEVETGRVLAIASTPTVDPNRLVAVDDESSVSAQRYWEDVLTDAERPLLLRATTGLYPPGSTFKVVTAATAIDLGLADPETVYVDDGNIVVDGRTLLEPNRPDPSRDTWTVAEGLAYSLNLVYAQIGLDLGVDALAAGSENFGIGHDIPFTLPTASGQIASSTDALASDSLLADTAFGQGELLVTPLHLALVACAVAGDGTVPVPTLLDRMTADGETVERVAPKTWRRAISAEAAAQVDRMMVDSATFGYARYAAIDGLRVGAKTGTAESGRDEPHSWFIGYATRGEGSVAVAVCIDFGGEGGGVALGIGRDLLLAANRGI